MFLEVMRALGKPSDSKWMTIGKCLKHDNGRLVHGHLLHLVHNIQNGTPPLRDLNLMPKNTRIGGVCNSPYRPVQARTGLY